MPLPLYQQLITPSLHWGVSENASILDSGLLYPQPSSPCKDNINQYGPYAESAESKRTPNLGRYHFSDVPRASEDQGGYLLLTERHLQALWFEQKYFRTLTTTEGERIEVVSPGVWNTEAGPDFLKAHLRINGEDIKGDVEIHLHEAGWYAHHHHEDDRYNSVILHLSYWQPATSQLILKKDHSSLASAYLEKRLSVPLSRLIQLIDLDLYPYKRFTGSGRCAQSLFGKLSEKEIKKLFAAAAHWRCERKVGYLQSRLEGRELQLAGGIAMAMGYKHNAEAFLDLFLALLPFRDLPEKELLAMGLGSCGFFEEGFKQSWETSSFFHQLKSLWWGCQDQVDHQAKLRLDHIRPLNHPVRRIVYVVKLLQDQRMEELWYGLMNVWQGYVLAKPSKNSVRNCKQELLSLIPDYQDSYWNSHFLFETSSKKENLPLIGKDLKQEIIINVVIPLLYALVQQVGNPDWWESFQQLYQSYRGVLTAKRHYLQLRFFGNGPKAVLLEPAQMLQGAYQLHKDFCVHYEASCEGCPFVERYAHFSLK